MACFHPIPAIRTTAGEIHLHPKNGTDGMPLRLPCGACLGCRQNQAQAWALRAQLELQQHEHAVFATATFDPEHEPNSISPRDLTLWLKRLRKEQSRLAPESPKLRFFAAGEYGERNQRPHYHAIIYGLSERETPRLEKTWQKGHVRVYPATPATIAYTAGYCSKKIGYKRYTHTKVNPNTGEEYEWHPPFRQMSKNPGIGSNAKQYLHSWRLYAVKDGHKMPVPRYLHDAWKQQATPLQLDELNFEKYLLTLNRDNVNLEAAEKIAQAQQRQQAEKRNL